MAKALEKKPAGPADKGLRIVARKDVFRRCGRTFGAEAVTIPLADLTQEDVTALKDEPQLVVVDVDIEPPKPDPATVTPPKK